MVTGRFQACVCLFLFAAAAVATPPDAAAPAAASTEARLLRAWELWQAGDLAQADNEFRALLKQRPQYKLAWLLYGDLLNARAGDRAHLPLPADDPRVQALSTEMERRLIRRDLSSDAVPANLIYASGDAPRVIVVDLKEGRLFLMQRGDDGWHRLRDHYAGIGRLGFNKRGSGDLRTPVGVYHISGYIPGSALPDLYGVGALTLDYPNDWDHADKRNGHGIWIHGVPHDTYVRAPQSSQGCVTLANEDLEALHKEVGAGTPVILADGVQWLYAEEATAQEQEWMNRLDAWRLAWLSANADRIQDFYSAPLKTRPVYHEFEVDRINLFNYPGEKDLVQARFHASRSTGGRSVEAPVEQFWRRDATGAWKIVLEKGVLEKAADGASVSRKSRHAKNARSGKRKR